VGKTLLLVGVVVFVTVFVGCENQMTRSIQGNSTIAAQETIRCAGLDRPSLLQIRDNVPSNYYTPYR